MSDIASTTPEVKVTRPSAGTDNHTRSYSTVKVNDTVGAIWLGVIAIILLGALLRALGQNRKLTTELALFRQKLTER